MIKSQITFKQLEAFAFVADRGGFRAAGDALGTTQPNISTRIAMLEHILQTPLFIRDAGSVRLTERGADLLRQTREILWAAETLLEQAGRRDTIQDRLRLGVTELVACTWLQAFMRAFRQSYPNIQVELQVDLSTFIEDRLADGRLDLAVQTGPFTSKMSGDIALGNAAYIWVATPELAAQIGQTPSLQTLFQRQVLTHAKHTQAGLWLHDMAHKHGLNTYQIVHSSALSACLPMARESLGVALLPAALVAPDITAGLLQKIDITCLPKALAFHARYNATSAPRFVAQAALCARDVMKLGSDIP